MPIKAKGSLANSFPRTEDEGQCHDDHPRFAAAYGRAPVSIPIPMRRCTNLGPCIESGGPLGPAVWLSRYCIFSHDTDSVARTGRMRGVLVGVRRHNERRHRSAARCTVN